MLAFKEWATVVDALAQGEQSIILRKGGIVEENDHFEVNSKDFLLLPTLFHQEDAMIKPSWVDKAPNTDYYLSTQTVILRYKAIVESQKRVDDWNELLLLDDQHVYQQKVVKERFDRWNDKGLYVLNVKIEMLPQEIFLDLEPQHMGCKSWIEI